MTNQPDQAHVVAAGTVDRFERCAHCGDTLMYRVNKDEQILFAFCGNISACSWAFQPVLG